MTFPEGEKETANWTASAVIASHLPPARPLSDRCAALLKNPPREGKIHDVGIAAAVKIGRA